MKLNIHSIIDVITNSSTEIYSYAADDAVEKAHEMIDEILKVAGSDKKSVDLFSIYIRPDLDYMVGMLMDEVKNDDYEWPNDTIKNLFLDMKKMGNKWGDMRKFTNEKILPALLKDELWKEIDTVDDYDGCERTTTDLVIKPKNSDGENLMSIIHKLTYEEAMYDG